MMDELEPIYRYTGIPAIARALAAEKERGSSHVDTRHLSKSNGVATPAALTPPVRIFQCFLRTFPASSCATVDASGWGHPNPAPLGSRYSSKGESDR